MDRLRNVGKYERLGIGVKARGIDCRVVERVKRGTLKYHPCHGRETWNGI